MSFGASDGTLIETLAGAGFALGLRPVHLERIARQLQIADFEPEEVVFHKGSAGLDLYIILSGRVAIRDPDAGGRTVAVMGPGDTPGDIAFIDSSERSMDAVSEASTRVAVLSQEDFFELVAENPIVGAVIFRNLAVELCRRLRLANEDVKDLTNQLRERT
jgi:CRP-like cAMP-binding protein